MVGIFGFRFWRRGIGRKFDRCSYHGCYLSRVCGRSLTHRSVSISAISFSKDVCDYGRLELVKIWDGGINDDSV